MPGGDAAARYWMQPLQVMRELSKLRLSPVFPTSSPQQCSPLQILGFPEGALFSSFPPLPVLFLLDLQHLPLHSMPDPTYPPERASFPSHLN